MLQFIIENKESLKLFYALLIGVICFVIFVKTDKLFRLSNYQGIRYFRNAFFFYGIGFITRYFLALEFFNGYLGEIYSDVINFLFEYFLIMAGFFLLYSLLWKKIEPKTIHLSSLFNATIFLFYFMTFIIVIMDFLWQTRIFMFLSQISLFVFASIISYGNYRRNNKKNTFLSFYFIAMLLSLLAWTSNTVAALYFNWNKSILIGAYALNFIIFLLFLYGVIKFTKKW